MPFRTRSIRLAPAFCAAKGLATAESAKKATIASASTREPMLNPATATAPWAASMAVKSVVATGMIALVAAAGVFKTAHEGALCCRYGGEEFVLLLEGMDGGAALAVAGITAVIVAGNPVAMKSAACVSGIDSPRRESPSERNGPPVWTRSAASCGRTRGGSSPPGSACWPRRRRRRPCSP